MTNTNLTVPNLYQVSQTIKVLSASDAQKLADLYLPVRLRDFWLSLHPLIQAYLFDSANCGEEFFILVDMEYARFQKLNMYYDRSRGYWRQGIKTEEINIEDYFANKKKYLSGAS